jgi:chromosome segregation ATPase
MRKSLDHARSVLSPKAGILAAAAVAAALATHSAAAQVNHNSNPGVSSVCQSESQYKADQIKAKIAGLEEKKKRLEAKIEEAQAEKQSLGKTAHPAGSLEAQIGRNRQGHLDVEIAKYKAQVYQITTEIDAASTELASINQCSG